MLHIDTEIMKDTPKDLNEELKTNFLICKNIFGISLQIRTVFCANHGLSEKGNLRYYIYSKNKDTGGFCYEQLLFSS